MTDSERVLRQKLAASHHILHFIGCDDLLATHLSARIPGTAYLLITPHNIPFEEVSASTLVKVDVKGRIVDANSYTVMPQAHNIHGAIYQASEKIMAAVHTHSLYGTAVASMKCGLLPINQHALRFYKDVAYHDLNGLALSNEGEEIVKSLGQKKVMLLRNHGLLTTGASIEIATYLMVYLERVCEIQVKTHAAHQDLVTIPASICEKIKAQFEAILSPDIDFEALVRRATRQSPIDYRQ